MPNINHDHGTPMGLKLVKVYAIGDAQQITTPPLWGTPPQEGNLNGGAEVLYSPPMEGWQAKPDGVVLPIAER